MIQNLENWKFNFNEISRNVIVRGIVVLRFKCCLFDDYERWSRSDFHVRMLIMSCSVYTLYRARDNTNTNKIWIEFASAGKELHLDIRAC